MRYSYLVLFFLGFASSAPKKNDGGKLSQGYYYRDSELGVQDLGQTCPYIGSIQCDKKTPKARGRKAFFYCNANGTWETKECGAMSMCFVVAANDGDHCRYLFNPFAWIARTE